MSITGGPVLILANSFAGGGAEDAMLTIHQAFMAKGVDSNFVAVNSNAYDSLPVTRTISLNREWHAGIFATLKSLSHFRKILQKISPEVIIVNCELPELIIAFTRVRNVRLICVEHTTNPWQNRRALGRVVRFLLQTKGCEWVTVIQDRAPIWGSNASPIQISNPFLRFENEEQKSSIEKISGVIFIGRMRKEKRPDWAIEAAIGARQEIHLFGGGEILFELKDKYAHFKGVHFHGYVDNFWKNLSNEVLIVVPSEFEGDGLVIVESIIMRKPLALADNPDLRRFKLPGLNYFKSVSELQKLIEENLYNNFKNLLPPIEASIDLKEKRSLERIIEKWLWLIFTKSPH